jgi:hypothetical protein
MDIQEARFLYSEHGDLCLVGDDECATVITVSKNDTGNFVIEFQDDKNSMSFRAFSSLDEALAYLHAVLYDIDGNFEFVY